ncbi:MAG: ribosomal protein S18-alanine N-acetyltransferase [Corynebacterium pyruviciproducens]|uniref:ribosomal protein S18-alanine N-acetyltransferase n=1 Tax=Corynebacterium pyruviciproducens TaxID=598660 RepID=UPI0039834D45
MLKFSPVVKLRGLTNADVGRLAELESQLFAGESPWSAYAFLEELASRWTYYVGATVDSELVGYAGLGYGLGEAEVHTIGVDPKFQGLGIGKLLLEDILAEADRREATVFLEVRFDNGPAISLYESHGFERLGVRKNYYQPSGADAITMRREAKER